MYTNRVLKKFDLNSDGNLDSSELDILMRKIDEDREALRYAGYSAGFARAFRYLAFTSDFGEALRPVVAKRVVNASYGISFGYCFADVAYEAYKLKKNNYIHENGNKMTMGQLVAERSTFQLVASIAVPFAVIHTAVSVSTKVIENVKPLMRFKRWGPSIVGLSCIPLLPMYLDHPVEHAIEKGFEKLRIWREEVSKKPKIE